MKTADDDDRQSPLTSIVVEWLQKYQTYIYKQIGQIKPKLSAQLDTTGIK